MFLNKILFQFRARLQPTVALYTKVSNTARAAANDEFVNNKL